MANKNQEHEELPPHTRLNMLVTLRRVVKNTERTGSLLGVVPVLAAALIITGVLCFVAFGAIQTVN